MDVFTTVIGILAAGTALFVGYRIGIKDGFRGGVHTGRVMERRQAEQERRFLLARAIHAEAELEARTQSYILAAPQHGVDFPDFEAPGALQQSKLAALEPFQ